MKKFMVKANEVVYYLKEVEAESEEQIKEMIFSGELSFDNDDIVEGYDFQVVDIEEQ